MSERTSLAAHPAGSPPKAVHMISDPESGLEGVIVLHSTRRGPAAGGCRFWHYPEIRAATRDALRLAEGMAYKNAMADLPLGGGKAVLRLPSKPFDRSRLFAAFGREVERLGGAYVTAEDVGTGVADMEDVRSQTDHVAGLSARSGRPGGDPSPWTALGVFLSMEEAVRRQFGSDLRGMTVAVQGLGHVGSHLCRLLDRAGARLVVADMRQDVAEAVAQECHASVVSPDAVLGADCDVFAPCALGAVIDAQSVLRLNAGVVCGAANNILASDADGDLLAERGVLYAPDYVVNSGGIVNVAGEYLGWSQDEVERRVKETGKRLSAVLDLAADRKLPPHRAADARARALIGLPSDRMKAA